MRIASVLLISLMSILILVGNVYGVENRFYGKEKINTHTIINISSIQIVADFYSYKDCLVGIKYYTGSTLGIITEQPSEISGFLINGTHFVCAENATDKKSIFVRGLITVK